MLEKINKPKDLKSLTVKELETLAGEIRKEIIKVVSKKGGHLSSNLGSVELTIALHYTLSTPRDKIVWDVGHQCYAHKILTGRRDRFHTIRQDGGLGGFPKRSESVYDVFDSGHASTSISVALGIACARDLKEEDYKVVAVVGDGSLTSGIAFEGLNQAGGLKKDLMVVLNDNKMSISKNVGAISRHLTRIITNPDYNRLQRNFQELMEEIPLLGERMLSLGKRVGEGVKGVLVPGTLFEELGFRYFGPIDGHNLEELIEIFKRVKDIDGPRLIHITTKKGKGYRPAEERPDVFHSAPPFDIKKGTPVPASDDTPSFSEVFSDTLIDLAGSDRRIVGITAAMSIGTGLDGFGKEFPDRFFDVGIAEEHSLVFAAGFALQGLKPVVAIYSTFLQRAYDQVLHDICLQNLPVIIAIDRSGVVGEDGPTHHGVFDISYLRHLPNIVLMSPKDEGELRHMLKTACSCKGPVGIRYPKGKGMGADLEGPLEDIEIGRAEILRRGKDVVVLAIGSMVYPSMEAAEILEKDGLRVGVVNARFVKPLDEKTILGLTEKHNNLVTVEENCLAGGFGSAVMEFLEEKGRSEKVRVKRIGLPDKFLEHSSRKALLKKYGLDAKGIAGTIKNWVKK